MELLASQDGLFYTELVDHLFSLSVRWLVKVTGGDYGSVLNYSQGLLRRAILFRWGVF